MPQPAPSPPSSSSPSFAGLLAAFASPAQKKPPARDLNPARDRARDLARDVDGLQDDVATLSYERALRAHARYHAPEESVEPAAWEPLEFSESPAAPPAEPLRIFEAAAAHEEPVPASPIPVARFAADAEPEPAAQDDPPGLDRNLKTASITIRLSRTECAQLRQRAAAAGLTVSAYLRSCTFETEALRALVKDTLAQMKSDKPRSESSRADAFQSDGARNDGRQPDHPRSWWRELLARFWPYGRVTHRVAQA